MVHKKEKYELKYRVIDPRTGKVRALATTWLEASKMADKLEPAGKYIMIIEKVK